MTVETPVEAVESPVEASEDLDQENAPDTDPAAVEDDSGTITYKRADIEKMRTEAKDNRKRAETAEAERDTYAARLHTELVRATGLMADPSDLPFDVEHLAETDKLATAIAELTDAKPHLRARAYGDAGQGRRGEPDEPFSLLNSLKGIG